MVSSLFSQLSISLSPSLVFAILAGLLAVWAIFTIIIRYHWKNYGVSQIEFLGMNLLYFVGSGILIAGMAGSALLFSFSAM